MWEDPIVKEIHAQRKKIAEAYDYDVKAIINYYREKQKSSGRKVATSANADRLQTTV